MRIFIADDNIEFASLFGRVAQEAGWSVTTCENGRELLDALALDDGPALLVVDVQMPERDGIQIIDDLARLDRHVRLRFITGGPESSALAARMVAKAHNLDVGQFLKKPLTIARFRDLLEEEAALLRGAQE